MALQTKDGYWHILPAMAMAHPSLEQVRAEKNTKILFGSCEEQNVIT